MSSNSVKFCVKCQGITDRNQYGICKICCVRHEKNRLEKDIQQAAIKNANKTPCAKCGSIEYSVVTGRCCGCSLIRDRKYKSKKKELAKNGSLPPCKKCGSTNRNQSGDCRPCLTIISAKSYAGDIDNLRAKKRAWAKENADLRNSYDADRRAQKLLATPAWADKKAIRVFYKLAHSRKKATGVEHAVDHQVPLLSPYVCGLHTEANLAVLTQAANSEKSNVWWPDMWEITPETPRYEKPKEI